MTTMMPERARNTDHFAETLLTLSSVALNTGLSEALLRKLLASGGASVPKTAHRSDLVSLDNVIHALQAGAR